MRDTDTITRPPLKLERAEHPAEQPAEAAGATSTAPPRIPVLIVDDDLELRDSCANLLRSEGYDVTVCGRGADAIDIIERRRFPVVIVDRDLPGVNGLVVLRAALAASADSFVVITSEKPSVDGSVEALQQGAWDYLPKPFSATQLQILVGRASEAIRKRTRRYSNPKGIPMQPGDVTLLGTSTAFQWVMEVAARVAPTNASVFITGESGVGKELIARFIHERSRRAQKPFVAVNCAALPEPLLESEMFGHKRGAFTDAVRDKVGLMESASGGTLFLDELLEMAPSIQAKLLRAVQDGVVRRVGSETTDAVADLRFIAATNRSLGDAVRDGSLREDLLYRLQVVRIHVPALRERREDIQLLASHFLGMYWARHGTGEGAPPKLNDAATAALMEHSWPGNVRELQNVIEHAVVFSQPGRMIDAADLPLTDGTWRPQLVKDTPIQPAGEQAFHALREKVVGEFEVRYLIELVERAGGNMARAARIAGIDRATLYRLMDRHGLIRRRDAIGLVEREPGERAERTTLLLWGVTAERAAHLT